MPRRPSKRRTVSKTSAKTQTPHSSLTKPEEIPPKRCYLKDMPNEIMGMIFGLLNLHDLGSMLCVSKWINTAFQSCTHSAKLRLVLQVHATAIKEICQQTRHNPTLRVIVHSILDAFIEQLCECGEYGWYVFWFSNPPRKLCFKCVKHADYQCALLKEAVKFYRLKKKDYADVPTIIMKRSSCRCYYCEYPFPVDSVIAQRSVLEEIALRNGTYPKRKQFPVPQESRWYHHEPPGVIKVPTFDLRRGNIINPLCCQNCVGTDHSEVSVIPHDYNHLRTHIVSRHPQILESFEISWRKLGHESQSLWTDEGLILPGTFYDPRSSLPAFWQSWAQVRYEQHNLAQTVNFEPEDLRETLALIIRENMPHAGALYDMPEIPTENTVEERIDEDPSDDGEFVVSHGVSLGTADLIAEQAAEAIMNAQLPKIVEMVTNDIKENGLEALRKWYP